MPAFEINPSRGPFGEIDANIISIVRDCTQFLDAVEADYALGGAVAMASYGYVRATTDVDLFVADDVRNQLLGNMKGLGHRLREHFEPLHYSLSPAQGRHSTRVDLLFPALGVETLGMMAAQRREVFGLELPVFPLAHIIALKLTTDPRIDRARYVKDLADLHALHERGLVDAKRVETVLRDVNEKGALRRLGELLQG